MAYTRYFKQTAIEDMKEFPLQVRFNFGELFEYWEQMAESEDEGEAAHAQSVLKRLEKAPVLRTSFNDDTIIEQHEAELRMLLQPMFSALAGKNEIKAACMPFHPMFFNMTERMQHIFDRAGDDLKIVMRMPKEDLAYISACAFILNFKCNAGFDYFRTIHFDVPDEQTRLMRHYFVFFNADHFRFIELEGFVTPTSEQIQELKENFDDVELWKKYFPPQSCILEGFGIANLFDITKEEAISQLKYVLLQREALNDPSLMKNIQQHLGSMLNMPNLKLGFANYDATQNMVQPLGHGIGTSISLIRGIRENAEDAFCNMSYPRIFEEQETFLLSSVGSHRAEDSILVKKLKDQGIESYLALPLKYGDEMIGILELGSLKAWELTAVTASVLGEVAVLFATALKRTEEEKETQLEAIIQDQCTAIHPSVSWRFFDAANDFLQARRQGLEIDTMEDIVFPEVYPLYGQSDIKGSSTERNLAIQGDMIEQFTLARNVLTVAREEVRLPIYDELIYCIDASVEALKSGLNAGDEITMLDFLKKEIYPVFNHLKKIKSAAAKKIVDYNQLIDPELGVIYRKRKAYEESVALINKKMAAYLDKAQEAAQQMFPHYYERYKTDGVEHNLYIGQSMVHKKEFDPLYLQNLQLWQLMVICEMENMVHRLKAHMPLPLDVASLVLVHCNPITIKFGMEEKRFDVEGAYNIRYEILKKRIDKALIKGTTERLTKVGKIAIVYSQEKEAEAYRHHMQYLRAIDYIGPDIEWVELNDLQGVTGLKAMRVDVVYHKDERKPLLKKSMEMVK
ncbi:MAG: GAF domain-containing protein [Bacteroidota bacterium]